MSALPPIRKRSILAATIIVAIVIAVWWRGQSVRQPQNTPIRQTSDIRSTDDQNQQAAQSAIDALR